MCMSMLCCICVFYTCSYDLYEPLHSLWQQYIEDLLQLKHHAGSNLSTLSTKLTRADLHGSLLTGMCTVNKPKETVFTAGACGST